MLGLRSNLALGLMFMLSNCAGIDLVRADPLPSISVGVKVADDRHESADDAHRGGDKAADGRNDLHAEGSSHNRVSLAGDCDRRTISLWLILNLYALAVCAGIAIGVNLDSRASWAVRLCATLPLTLVAPALLIGLLIGSDLKCGDDGHKDHKQHRNAKHRLSQSFNSAENYEYRRKHYSASKRPPAKSLNNRNHDAHLKVLPAGSCHKLTGACMSEPKVKV